MHAVSAAEFMCASLLLHLENTVSLCLFTASGSYSLLSASSTMMPESWGKECNLDISFGAQHLIVHILCTLSSHGSLLVTVHCNKLLDEG